MVHRSAVINTTTFWMLGGLGDVDEYTEVIWEGQVVGDIGPKLPYLISQMCAVKLSAQEIFLIGGWDGSQCINQVWVFDPQNEFERKEGVSLNMKRCSHSCSIMRDGEKIVIVVAGGYTTVPSL